MSGDSKINETQQKKIHITFIAQPHTGENLRNIQRVAFIPKSIESNVINAY